MPPRSRASYQTLHALRRMVSLIAQAENREALCLVVGRPLEESLFRVSLPETISPVCPS